MILNEIRKKETIIFCPSELVTGGTELLHQLCDQLNNSNLNSSIFYIGDCKITPAPFKSYNLKICEEIDSHAVLIFPETLAHLTKLYKNFPVFIWWLSVDNYFKYSADVISTIEWSFSLAIRKFLGQTKMLFMNRKLKPSISFNQIRSDQIFHLYQSAYANYFLKKNNITQSLKLTDYLNTEFLAQKKTGLKKDIVLYNPLKGYAFTKKLIKKYPDIKWIAIQNKTRDEVNELLACAKIYIDFGHHPGKDRLPREAAINGCCIITSKEGSAYFFEDIPISKKYKFATKCINIPKIHALIENILTDYNEHKDEFQFYRNRIMSEYNEFKNEVKSIFS